MKKGSAVRLIQPIIQGSILSTRYNEDLECLEHLVEWTDAEGETHQRFFPEAQLEEVEQ